MTWPSRPIHVAGFLVGAVVAPETGVRFLAVGLRVTDIDQTVRPDGEHAIDWARQLVHTGRISHFTPTAIEE
jgi:hypothetical protein